MTDKCHHIYHLNFDKYCPNCHKLVFCAMGWEKDEELDKMLVKDAVASLPCTQPWATSMPDDWTGWTLETQGDKMKTIVVSRHESFVEYLEEQGLIPEDAEVIDHVFDPQSIQGKHVVGMLPFNLAAEAQAITFVALDLSLEQRKREKETGEELSLEEIRQIAGPPQHYKVERIRLKNTPQYYNKLVEKMQRMCHLSFYCVLTSINKKEAAMNSRDHLETCQIKAKEAEEHAQMADDILGYAKHTQKEIDRYDVGMVHRHLSDSSISNIEHYAQRARINADQAAAVLSQTKEMEMRSVEVTIKKNDLEMPE